jgi:hypothetical protein
VKLRVPRVVLRHVEARHQFRRDPATQPVCAVGREVRDAVVCRLPPRSVKKFASGTTRATSMPRQAASSRRMTALCSGVRGMIGLAQGACVWAGNRGGEIILWRAQRSASTLTRRA